MDRETMNLSALTGIKQILINVMLQCNVSIPDADFSCHPAHLTKSTGESHQSVVTYGSLWSRDCKKKGGKKSEHSISTLSYAIGAAEVTKFQPSISKTCAVTVFRKR